MMGDTYCSVSYIQVCFIAHAAGLRESRDGNRNVGTKCEGDVQLSLFKKKPLPTVKK